MKRSAILVAGVVAAALSAGLAACGGDDEEGNEIFREEGFDLSFAYPAEFDVSTDVEAETEVGDGTVDRAGVELEDRNGVYIVRGELNFAITATNLGTARSEYDSLIAQLAGRRLNGRETEVGGLPALSYSPFEAAGVTNRTTVVFDGDVQYQFNCQWNEENRNEIEEACDLALRTLRGPGSS